MNTDVIKQIQAEDAKLAEYGVAIPHRQLQVFKAVHGKWEEFSKAPELWSAITEWYRDKYGELAVWDQVIGRMPVALEGKIVAGSGKFEVEEGVDLLDSAIDSSHRTAVDVLDPEEKSTLRDRIRLARQGWIDIYHLTLEDLAFSSEEKDFFYRASADIRSACVLCVAEESQNAIAAAHAAVEKFLKLLLLRYGKSKRDVERLRHSLDALFVEVLKVEPRLDWLNLATERVGSLAPDAGIRYQRLPRSTDTALDAFYSSIFTCGIISTVLLNAIMRGTRNATFRETRFYRNSVGGVGYCKSVNGPDVTLVMFHSSPSFGSFMVDTKLQLRSSILWLEITDVQEDARFRGQLIWHYRNRGTRSDPANTKVKLVHSAEGSWAAVEFRRQITKEQYEKALKRKSEEKS